MTLLLLLSCTLLVATLSAAAGPIKFQSDQWKRKLLTWHLGIDQYLSESLLWPFLINKFQNLALYGKGQGESHLAEKSCFHWLILLITFRSFMQPHEQYFLVGSVLHGYRQAFLSCFFKGMTFSLDLWKVQLPEASWDRVQTSSKSDALKM